MTPILERSDIDQAVQELIADLGRTIKQGLALPYLVIADKHGKVIKQIPEPRFHGLKEVINTGYSEGEE